MIDMIMFGWTFRWFHQKKRLSSDAGFVEYEGFWFAVKLITRVFSWPFDWFHGATYSPWLISFLERTSESPWYSKCQPLIFPQGKLLSYSKTLFTMFSVLLAQFSQIIFCRSAFFIQLYTNKDFQSSCELMRTVYFSVLSNNLSNWCHEQFFFAPTLYKKNSIFCRWNKSTHDFIPHLFVSVFSCFGAHSPVHLWQV